MLMFLLLCVFSLINFANVSRFAQLFKNVFMLQGTYRNSRITEIFYYAKINRSPGINHRNSKKKNFYNISCKSSKKNRGMQPTTFYYFDPYMNFGTEILCTYIHYWFSRIVQAGHFFLGRTPDTEIRLPRGDVLFFCIG